LCHAPASGARLRRGCSAVPQSAPLGRFNRRNRSTFRRFRFSCRPLNLRVEGSTAPFTRRARARTQVGANSSRTHLGVPRDHAGGCRSGAFVTRSIRSRGV
jgi:hypothetical protein